MAEIEDLSFETDNVVAAEDAEDKIFDSASAVVSFVSERFKRAEDAREGDEERWLRAYRNYRGLYGPDVQFTETEKSRVFVKVTKTKTLAAYGSWMFYLAITNSLYLWTLLFYLMVLVSQYILI